MHRNMYMYIYINLYTQSIYNIGKQNKLVSRIIMIIIIMIIIIMVIMITQQY